VYVYTSTGKAGDKGWVEEDVWSEGGGSEEGCLSKRAWLGRWGKKRTSVGAQLMTSVRVVKEFGEIMGMIDVW
jgi:hypothetical protein